MNETLKVKFNLLPLNVHALELNSLKVSLVKKSLNFSTSTGREEKKVDVLQPEPMLETSLVA